MACNHDCTNCGACSRGASPVTTNSYSSASSSSHFASSNSSNEIFTNQIYACAGHGSDASCSSHSSYSSSGSSYSGSSMNSSSFGSSYSSLDAMVSAYQGSGNSAQGDYSGISMSAMKNDYAINLDSIIMPIIYENRTSINQGMNNKGDYQNNQSRANFQNYNLSTTPGMNFTPSPFLKKNRPYTMFVGQAYEIQDFIKEAFKATTGKELPKDVIIEVCSKQKMKETHEAFGGKWSDNIQGFAINKKHLSNDSLIFVSNGPLDKVMLTIGHEIGHVMSKSLKDIHSEESKAFAFSIAWMKAIKENNIAGLADAIELDQPARNGLHNVALDFVMNAMKTGRNAMDVFVDLIENKIETTCLN